MDEDEFISQFYGIYIVFAIDYISGQEQYKKTSQVYLKDQKLKEYFAQGESIYFVSELLYNSDFEQKTLVSFLRDVGVKNIPERIEVAATLTFQEKELLRKKTDLWTKSGDWAKDYTIEGIDFFLNNPTKTQSIALWNILVNAPTSYLQGEYEWKYYKGSRKEYFEAKFIKILKQKNWLYDKDGNLHKPSNIELNCLSEEYAGESSSATLLVTLLEFKPEIIDQLPMADRNKLELVRGISIEELRIMLDEFKKSQKPVEENLGINNEAAWEPQVSPEDAQVHIEEVDSGVIISEDLKGQSGSLSLSEGNDTEEDKQEGSTDSADKISDKTKKAIGDYGEKCVLKVLREKFGCGDKAEETDFGFKVTMKNNDAIEVVWLNKHNNVGKGHDFIIKKNNIETEYIEVKTKLQDKEELIEITGTQWEFARALFNQDEGNKYFIYVVLSAGTSDIKLKIISNPIKLWIEGKLYAHPVKFRL